MIQAYLISFLVTFFICLGVINLFKRFEIVDKPDGLRKIHKGNVPLGGGLVLFLSITIILYLIFPEYYPGTNGDHPGLSSIWFISLIILIMGLWDDINPMKPAIRIVIQVLASWFVIVITDIYIRDLGNLLELGNIQLGVFGIPITIFMVVGVCNAFNMLDGMDGLVASLLLIPSLFIAYISLINGLEGLLFLGSSCLIVFLIFNLGLFGKNFKIFLGDSGSMWLGFLSAWILICLTQNETKYNFAPVTALWFILIPLIDAISTFITRAWNKKSMFDGDRSHLHHILLDAGIKKWKVLLIFIALSLLSSFLGFYFIQNNTPEYLQFYGFLTAWFLYHLLFKTPPKSSKDLR